MNIIYKIAKECLGKDIALTQNELGCAEAVNYIFKKAISEEVGGDLSTYRMYMSLKKDPRFFKVFQPKEGDIIISPTGFGKGNGHVGIMSDNNKVMSNNSYTYLWDEHLDLNTWKMFFKSFPIEFFRYKYAEKDIHNASLVPPPEPPKSDIIKEKEIMTLQMRVIELAKKLLELLRRKL